MNDGREEGDIDALEAIFGQFSTGFFRAGKSDVCREREPGSSLRF